MSSYDEKCAVRIGVLDSKRQITEQDIMNEIEHIRLASKIEAIFIESDSSLRSSPESSVDTSENDENPPAAESVQQHDTSEANNQHNNSNNKTDAPSSQASLSSSSSSTATTVKMTTATATSTKSAVVAEVGEPKVDPRTGKSIQWARVFMSNSDVADECAAEFAFPGAQFRWRLIVQRLPIVDHFAELERKMRDAPNSVNPKIASNIYHPVRNCPIPQIVVVDTQEGYVPFMTTEIFHTKGLEDYLAAKEGRNVLMRRTVCKHYDPQVESDCFFGVSCTFVHLHAAAMDRLLRIQSFKNRLRFPQVRRAEDAIPCTNWEVERRNDTLMVRDVPESVGHEQLNYMFSGCQGFVSATLRNTPYEGRRYGVVRFSNRRDATSAMAQTFGSGLSVCFFGALEDLRALRIKETLQEEDDARRQKIQEREEQLLRHHQQQQQQQRLQHRDGRDDDSNKSAAATDAGECTSQNFGGDGVAAQESGGQRRRPREGTEQVDGNDRHRLQKNQNSVTTKQFENEVLELRQSDSDNDHSEDGDADDDDDGKQNGKRKNRADETGRYSRSRTGGTSSSSPSESDDGDEGDSSNNDDNSGTSDGGSRAKNSSSGDATDSTQPSSGLPPAGSSNKPTADDFPALPAGWDWGFTRRLNRYYFFETLKRNKTQWKHPVTNKSYASGGIEC